MDVPSRRGLGAPFWSLFAAGSTSSLADGTIRAALPLLAASLTRDPLLISALTAAGFLPWLLFSLLSGAVVDRVDRRRAMAAADLARAAGVGLLGAAVVLDVASIGLVYAAAFALTTARTVHDSAARATLPQLVRPDQLESGNSLIATEETVCGSFLGAPIGAALVAAAVALPLLTTSVAYTAAAILVLSIRRDLRPARSGTASLRTDVRQGVRWIWRHRLLRDLTLVTAVLAVGLYMTSAVLVLYVLETLGVAPATFGLFMVCAGAGSLAGGLGAPRIRVLLGRRRALVGAALLGAVATLSMGLTTTPVVGGALFALVAFGGTVWDVLAMSLRQVLVPEELFGRVQGAYRTAVWGVIPVASVIGGAVAGAVGVPAVFVLGGGSGRCSGRTGLRSSPVRGGLDPVLAGGGAEHAGAVVGGVDVDPVTVRGRAHAEAVAGVTTEDDRQRDGADARPLGGQPAGRPPVVHVPALLVVPGHVRADLGLVQQVVDLAHRRVEVRGGGRREDLLQPARVVGQPVQLHGGEVHRSGTHGPQRLPHGLLALVDPRDVRAAAGLTRGDPVDQQAGEPDRRVVVTGEVHGDSHVQAGGSSVGV